MAGFVGLSNQNVYFKELESSPNETWVPEDSDILTNAETIFNFFPNSITRIEVVNKFAIGFESKEEGKLLTLAAFQEMIDFD